MGIPHMYYYRGHKLYRIEPTDWIRNYGLPFQFPDERLNGPHECWVCLYSGAITPSKYYAIFPDPWFLKHLDEFEEFIFCMPYRRNVRWYKVPKSLVCATSEYPFA